MASLHSPQGYVYEMCDKEYMWHIFKLCNIDIENLKKGHFAMFQKTEASYQNTNHLLNPCSLNAHYSMIHGELCGIQW